MRIRRYQLAGAVGVVAILTLLAMVLPSRRAEDRPPPVSGTPAAQQGQILAIQLLMGDPSKGEMTFSPDTITVRNGETVKFVIKNTGAVLHEIRSDLFRFTQADLEVEGVEIETMGLREIEVPPGKEVEVQMTIRVSQAVLSELDGQVSYEFGCFVPGHYRAGMKGTLVVRS
jgi:uncharacterized cupredoxin-like copper-binding protein